jgi:hypothetical protein
VTRYTWNIIGDDGDWSSVERGKNWSIDLANSELSSEGLLQNLLVELIRQNKRAEVAKWLTPEEKGDWSISHTNPMKHAVREIAPWTDARLLSEVIEQGAYELKAVGTKKLVQLWLCWQPEQPPPPDTPTPLRKVPIKKEKGVKKAVKQEMKAEPLSSIPSTPLVLPKRPRSLSGETPIRKRGAVTRALNALRATAEEEEEDDDDSDGEQLEPLEKLLGGRTRAGQVGNSEV